MTGLRSHNLHSAREGLARRLKAWSEGAFNLALCPVRGVLDRLDSLTFAAPLYFHLLAYFAIERF